MTLAEGLSTKVVVAFIEITCDGCRSEAKSEPKTGKRIKPAGFWTYFTDDEREAFRAELRGAGWDCPPGHRFDLCPACVAARQPRRHSRAEGRRPLRPKARRSA